MRRNFLRISLLATFLLCVLPVLTSCSNKAKKAQEAFDKALDFMYANDTKNAISQFKKSIKYDGTNPDVWYNYGSFLLENKSYADAISAFEKTTEFFEKTKFYENPDDLKFDALVNIGEAHLWQGDISSAAKKFQDIYDSAKENKNLVLNIVTTFIRCGHFDAALDFIKNNITTGGVKAFLQENKLFLEMIN